MAIFSWKNERANFLDAYWRVDEEERLAKTLKGLSPRETQIARESRKNDDRRS